MFFKKIFCFVMLVLTNIAFCGVMPSFESKKHVFEKQLSELEQKKKLTKSQLELDALFNEYVDDAKKLLEYWNEQRASAQEEAKKEETVKQIGHYMAVLQKLLAIMNSPTPEPLENFCGSQTNDELWGSICGDRPSKREPQRYTSKKRKDTLADAQINQQTFSSLTIQHTNDPEELQRKLELP